jgi:hypothetical protein
LAGSNNRLLTKETFTNYVVPYREVDEEHKQQGQLRPPQASSKKNEIMRDAVAKREAMKGGASSKGPVVVTGASGFVGSWLVMKLLQAGYTVRATVRDPGELSRSASSQVRAGHPNP